MATVVVLPAPCRPAISTIAGGAVARFRASLLVAHDMHELVVHDLDELLAGIQRVRDHLADGLSLDLVDEGLDHGQRHIGLEQRHAHIAQRLVDIFFRQTGSSGKRTKGVGEAV